MMGSNLVFVIAVSLLVCGNVSRVQSADECKTHADCLHRYGRIFLFCCGGLYFNWGDEYNKDRSCWSGSCLGRYCSKDSDCGDPSMCCRSNKCVNKGCLGCNNNTDCDNTHVCCKKTFVFNQTLCAGDCINQDCSWNDDCAGTNECCRSGKCTTTGCWDKCESNSDCDFGQYCCRKKNGTFWMWRNAACAKSCVGEICSTSEDCGQPNECCISNKCVTSGCSGCTTNSDCSSGHYCCRKRQWYELSECSADCVGKSCSSTEDCGGPAETCDSDYRCDNKSSLPPWLIAVITVSIVVLFVVIGIILTVFWCIRSKKTANTAQAGTVALRQDARYREGGFENAPPNTKFSADLNPAQAAAFQNQPRGTNGAQNDQTQVQAYQNAAMIPQERNENRQLYVNYRQQNHNQGLCQLNNSPNNRIYNTLESPYPAQHFQYHEYQESNGNQMYPLNTPYQVTC